MSAYLRRDGPQKRWALKSPYNVLEVPAKAELPPAIRTLWFGWLGGSLRST